MKAPLLDERLVFSEAEEDLIIQQFVPELVFEGLTVAFLSRRTRFDIQALDSKPWQPLRKDFDDPLRAVFRPYECREPVEENDVRRRLSDAAGVDLASLPFRQACAPELLDKGNHPEAATIVDRSLFKVEVSETVWTLRFEPDA